MSVRMQIYLTRELYQKLKEKSNSSRKPMAEHIRESLHKYLEEEEPVQATPGDRIWKIAGRGQSDLADLSTGHDQYLYAPENGKTE